MSRLRLALSARTKASCLERDGSSSSYASSTALSSDGSPVLAEHLRRGNPSAPNTNRLSEPLLPDLGSSSSYPNEAATLTQTRPERSDWAVYSHLSSSDRSRLMVTPCRSISKATGSSLRRSR